MSADHGGAYRVGLVQMCSTEDVSENLADMVRWIGEAAASGVRLVAFPENATQLAPAEVRIRDAEPLEGRQISTLRDAAARHGIHVLVGSFGETSADPARTWNTQVLIGRDGGLRAVYRKVHLFDIDLAPDTRMMESASVVAGPPSAVVAELDGWRVGMSICYDLRFPELYRSLSAQGADLLAVPAAFTFRTGQAHWNVLLRARAVENLSYVIAPAQTGRHYGNRESWGHSLVVSPWGEVIAERDDGTGLLTAELRRKRVEEVRRALPALSHRRMG